MSQRAGRIETFLRGHLLSAVGCALAATSCAGAPVQRPERVQPPAAAPAPPMAPVTSVAAARKAKVIVCVWDGLRPDSISEAVTPHLARLRDRQSVNFTDHHSVYPTFTMMNAAALATGAYPGQHGFYGNTEYQPGPTGQNAEGKALDFSQPIFTEDHGVLQALDAFYRARGERGIFAVGTLFEAAHAAGLRTAAVGKIGPAFLQDMHPDDARSVLLDENIALPFGFAKALQATGYALPANSAHYPFSDGRALELAPNNGKPTAALAERQVRLADGATPDPRATAGSAHNVANGYLMDTFVGYVLPEFDPDLSVVWLRNPDSTEHQFGPGTPNYLDALRNQDALLGQLQTRLGELGLAERTDLIVMSDHGHSTVAGDPDIFPLRTLTGEADGHGAVGTIDAQGFAVSGEIRSADVLARAGFRHIFDGGGCLLDPVLTGIRRDGSLVYPTRSDRSQACAVKPAVSPTGKQQAPTFQYSTPSFRVPEAAPKDAIVIAANGGSEYFYLLDHAPTTIRALVRALQERRAYGPIFVHSRYGSVAGTFPLSTINAENERSAPPTPDLIVSFDWNESAVTGGNATAPGTEYASAQRYRGMHGSFSPRDVHNVLIAHGPHFKQGLADALPTANVDVAPTVAAVLGLSFAAPAGRVLHEALAGANREYRVEVVEQRSEPVRLARTCSPDDPGCVRPRPAVTYLGTLRKKVLSAADGSDPHTYFDRAWVTREQH